MITQRSKEKELIDLGPGYYTAKEYKHCLKMLFKINRLLGIFSHTLKQLKRLTKDTTSITTPSVLDIGCGGGLFLLNLSKHLPNINYLGMDISADAIHIAQQELISWQTKHPCTQVAFQLQNLQHSLPENMSDIILTTLVCHHLTDDELVVFLQDVHRAARQTVIINDLHRHPFAERLYKLISPLFRNRLISHDGLISIRRGFNRNEWISLLNKAEIKNYQIKWHFPFRWSVILWKT
jgi:2-polyprenyl-3-methyl-5-hydroxy-6-metoxy-1,4-benzoquinol methylase